MVRVGELADVRAGIWTELDNYPVAIDVYRRNLQRAHVEMLTDLVKQQKPASDLPALARSELAAIAERIKTAAGNEQDSTTTAHLTDVGTRIQQTLDPRGTPPAAAREEVASQSRTN